MDYRRKIDVHCHTTYRTLKDVACEDASLSAISKLMRQFHVERTVLLATYFPHKGSGISNYRLLHWLKHYQESWQVPFHLFGSLDFRYYFYQGFNELEELAEDQVLSGIKIYSGYQDVDYGGEKVGKVFDLANRSFVPVMFHGGYSRGCMRKYGRPAFTRNVYRDELMHLAGMWPMVTIIVSHLNSPFEDELIDVMKEYRNVVTDISGVISSKHDRQELPDVVEATKKVLGEVGPKRVMFGTDFPVQTHEDSILIVERAMEGYSEEDKDDVYYNNACMILRR